MLNPLCLQGSPGGPGARWARGWDSVTLHFCEFCEGSLPPEGSFGYPQGRKQVFPQIQAHDASADLFKTGGGELQLGEDREPRGAGVGF